MWSPIHISSFKTIFVCFSKEVFRLMSDRSLGCLLHSPCHGIRRVCVVVFGPETKTLVACYQEKEEKITRRRNDLTKPENVKLEPSQSQPWDTVWTVKSPGAAVPLLTMCLWVCSTREACTLPLAPAAPSALARGSNTEIQPQARL